MYERQYYILHEPAAGFDWDEGNREKCLKHGVSIAEIEALLRSDPAIAPDLRHSAEEDRFIAVGRNSAGRPPVRRLHLAYAGRPAPGPARQRPLHASEGGRAL